MSKKKPNQEVRDFYNENSRKTLESGKPPRAHS